MEDTINRIKRSLLHFKSIFVHGGWGIGKTYLIKNEFMEEYKNDFNILYIDSRVIDFNGDVFDIIADYIESNLSKKELISKYTKKALKYLLNASIVVSNVLTSANLKTIKTTNEKNISTNLSKKTKNDKDTLIILDELDRITPKSILKILNYVNGLSFAFSQTKNIFKIMVVGNKVELKKILSSQFNTKDKDGFLEKYFEEQIDIDRIRIQAMIEIANSKMFFKNIDWEKVPINARELEKKYIKLENLVKKYGQEMTIKEKESISFSPAVFYAFFVCDIFWEKEKSLESTGWKYKDDGYETHFFRKEKEGNTKTIFSGKFFWNDLMISRSMSKGFSEALSDIIAFHSLDRFEEWVIKWKSKFMVPRKSTDWDKDN